MHEYCPQPILLGSACLVLVTQVEVLQSDLQLHMDVVALGRLFLLIPHAPKAAKPREAATPKEPATRTRALKALKRSGMPQPIYATLLAQFCTALPALLHARRWQGSVVHCCPAEASSAAQMRMHDSLREDVCSASASPALIMLLQPLFAISVVYSPLLRV